jgi:hypothetical protein
MTNFMDKYFGPLHKDSCIYFQFLMIFFFCILVIVFFAEIYYVFTNYKTLNFRIVMNGLILLINMFIMYFIYRLFYSMCSKSLA